MVLMQGGAIQQPLPALFGISNFHRGLPCHQLSVLHLQLSFVITVERMLQNLFDR